MGPNGSTLKFPDQGSSSCAVSESDTDCPVASRLPRDIRVQPDETRISDKVKVRRQLTHDFRREEYRAHPLQAVRIVDAYPRDHWPSNRVRSQESVAPRNVQLGSTDRKASSMTIRPSAPSSDTGRRFV